MACPADRSTDIFTRKLKPKEGSKRLQQVTHRTSDGFGLTQELHALIVRSANLVWRAKISLYQGGDATRPYVLAFKNLMFDHIHGSAPPEARGIEIKLGEGGGFVWVRPFEEELQTTDVGHVFELRDQYHTPMVSIRLRAGQAAEEL